MSQQELVDNIAGAVFTSLQANAEALKLTQELSAAYVHQDRSGLTPVQKRAEVCCALHELEEDQVAAFLRMLEHMGISTWPELPPTDEGVKKLVRKAWSDAGLKK